MTPPLVTVLIPAFNAERTIARALDSVFRQAYQPLEVLVVDDASTDGTAAVVAAYGRSEIRLISLPSNRGECSVNEGLARAKGEYVAFLDADDEWLDEKLKKQIAILESNPRLSFVTCGCLFVDGMGRPFREFGLNAPPFPPDEIWRGLLEAPRVAKPCVVARRSTLAAVGSFNPSLAVGGDQDMWIRLALAGEVAFLPELLVKAYEEPNSLTKRYSRRIAEFVLPMVKRHIADQRARLSNREVRRILGQRYTWLGRSLYTAGSPASGLVFLMAAILKGNQINTNLWYLITASPPSRWAKARLSRLLHRNG
jgi:glycosyltransferase involved in cell wall biosynthesis